MVVCLYFQQGRCKYGERCRNEHPRQSAFGGSGNRFGALSGGGLGGPSRQQTNYDFNASDIKSDLTAGKGRPEWIFSSYGPGKHAPRQLFGGPQREQSFEEMRLRHYEAAAKGNMAQAMQEAQTLYADCVRQMEAAINNPEGAVKYILEGANEHPNRLDILKGSTSQPAQGTTFGQPSSINKTQPPLNQSSPFGQPAFGRPSIVGQTSGFGRPSAIDQGGALGQPLFGQPAFGQLPFGQPATHGTSTFGQPSIVSPFSVISNQNQQPGSFGQPSELQTASPFAQLSGAQPAPTGFGQPSKPTPNPFGQLAQSQPFGQQPAGQSSFGTPQLAMPPPTQSPTFAQQPSPLGFGQPPSQPAVQPAAQPDLEDNKKRAFIKIDDEKELNPLPYMTGETVRDKVSNRLIAWKGQPVKYINDHPCYLHPQDQSTFVRILFPDGPPDSASLRDAQGKPEEYTAELKEQYDFFFSNGYFKDGVIPPVPPKSEWLAFDF